MRFDSVIFLISNTETKNRVRDTIRTPVKRETYAEKQSIRQSEFYQAATSGLKPEITFVIWALEYNGEVELEYNGKNYVIIRTFDKNDKELELICSGIVNKAAT
jgi:SPP1 family predicted phage head-tail adaptor